MKGSRESLGHPDSGAHFTLQWRKWKCQIEEKKVNILSKGENADTGFFFFSFFFLWGGGFGSSLVEEESVKGNKK